MRTTDMATLDNSAKNAEAAAKAQAAAQAAAQNQKIIGQTVNPAVHLLQITQSTLFNKVVQAKADPELPTGPVTNRALKLIRSLAPGAQPLDTEYGASFSHAILPDVDKLVLDDKLP